MTPLSEYRKDYKCILADPPWPYHSQRAVVGNGGRGNQGGRAAQIVQVDVSSHYDTMTIAEIKGLPVPGRSGQNCHLYLWTTNSFIVEAHEVAKSWGFKPKTLITWGKIKKDSRLSFEPSCKTGYWFRSATEHCLFCVKGKMRLKCKDAVPTLFLEERHPHSIKPESFRGLIEHCSQGPYLELFARSSAHGWDGWGNQFPEVA